jgi:hypothetical protein
LRASPLRRCFRIAGFLFAAAVSSAAAPGAGPATPFAVEVRLLAVAGQAARAVPFDHPFAAEERVRFEVRPSRSCYVRLVQAGPGDMRLRLWPEDGVLPLVAGQLKVLPAGGVLRFDRQGDQRVELVFSLVASPKHPERQARKVPLLPAGPVRGVAPRFAGTLDGEQTAALALTLRRR